MPTLALKPKDNKKLSAYFRRLAKELPNAVNAALRETAEDMLDAYESTVSSWDEPATFVLVETDKGYTVYTDDEVWNMLEHGTKPHTIEASSASNPLAFQSQYQAKTIAGNIPSQAGGPSGDYVFALSVEHPGTKPRRWHSLIYKQFQPKVVKNVRAALRAGVEAIGL